MTGGISPGVGTQTDRGGLIAGLACYSIWGLLPILFQALERAGTPPFELVAWRTAFALPVAFGLVLAVRGGGAVRAFTAATWRALALSAGLILFNWSLYVWAVGHGRTLEASLGYYLNPLLNMAAGRFLFGEKIERAGWIAIGLAAFGVAVQAVALGALPLVSVGLALSFSAYAVVRKRVDAPAQAGLFAECLILFLPACAFLAWTATHGGLAIGRSPGVTAMLLACGPATVAPLALFAIAARRLPLTLVGFLQFISPTLQFAVGVADGEHLSPLALLSFVFIWAGVAVFAGAAILKGRAERRAVASA